MRFTVKAKLACAFGAIILLSAVAGGLAYVKLSDMISTAEALVARANRMQKATELEKNILLQVRAEKNAILVPEGESARFVTELNQLRQAGLTTKDEIHATASEEGRKLVEVFGTVYGKLAAVQDDTLKLVQTDKAKAAEHSMSVGRKAAADAMDAANAYVEYAKKAMGEQAEAAKEEGAHAQLLLSSIV